MLCLALIKNVCKINISCNILLERKVLIEAPFGFKTRSPELPEYSNPTVRKYRTIHPNQPLSPIDADSPTTHYMLNDPQMDSG